MPTDAALITNWRSGTSSLRSALGWAIAGPSPRQAAAATVMTATMDRCMGALHPRRRTWLPNATYMPRRSVAVGEIVGGQRQVRLRRRHRQVGRRRGEVGHRREIERRRQVRRVPDVVAQVIVGAVIVARAAPRRRVVADELPVG